MKKYILLSIIVFSTLWVFSPSIASAANHYIRAGATGANNGSDWANAWTDIPVTLTRGDTYYIADGTYGGYDFDDADNGTWIYIKKAIESDRGTGTGWLSSYDDGVATFTSELLFSTGHYSFDGLVGSDKTGHGFHIDMAAQTGIHTAIKMHAHNITIAHTKISWPDRDSELYMSPTSGSRGIEPYGSYNNIQLRYIYISECPSVPVRMMGGDNFLMEYSVMDGNHNDAERHASGLMSMYGNTNNGVVRYNKFMNIEGSYVIGLYGGSGFGMHDNWKIYGNLFIWDNSSEKTGGVSYMIGSNQDVNNIISNTTVYNNTFADLRTPGGWGKIDLTYGSGNYVYNNVFYGLIEHYFMGSPTLDYNYYSKCHMLYYYSQQPHDTPIYDGGNGYYSTITANPFVNSAAGDFRLSAALTGYTGLTLSSPYNYDMLGNARGADGTWDRGTYEYTGGTPPPTYCGDSSCNGTETCSSCPTDCGVCSDTQAPSIPTNLSAAAVSSLQINLFWAASSDNVGVTGYRVYRGGIQIGTSATNSYSDTGLSPSTSYSYTVSAYDAAGNVSAQSALASATTQTAGTAVFNIGDRVQVTADPSLRVRSTPGLSDATILGIQLKGSQGTVINGPVSLDGYIWWQIDYDVPPDGWSIEAWLAKAGIDTTPPAAPTGVVVN